MTTDFSRRDIYNRDHRNEARETELRENVRQAINAYKAELKRALDITPRGSGHAINDYDDIQASLTQLDSAMRVLWMED